MTFPPKVLRIGGEFEFTPRDYTAGICANAPTEVHEANCIWTDTGRSALLIAAQTILRRGGVPRVWLPAYSCESIAQPFGQAGYQISYYSAAPPLTGIVTDPPEPKRGEVFLFIHYFGHTNTAMVEAANRFRSAGVWIIEDCVQASLADRHKITGDFAFTSLRKVMAVPDGAALLSLRPIESTESGIELAGPDEAFLSAKLLGKVIRGSQGTAETFLPLLSFAEGRLSTHIVPRQMSWLSRWMCSRMDGAAAAAIRRGNWLALSEQLITAGLDAQLKVLFRTLSDNDVPLGLPVRVRDGRRDALRRFLMDRQIFCPVHWPLEHLGPTERFADERQLAASVLTLPVDQRMSGDHIKWMVHALVSFFGESE